MTTSLRSGILSWQIVATQYERAHAPMHQLVNLNGAVVPYSAATVHVDDRGFTFGDGIYEVVRVYNGQPFKIARHMGRLQRSADALRLRLDPGPDEIERRCRELVHLQQLDDAQIYIQVTRGSAPRAHA